MRIPYMRAGIGVRVSENALHGLRLADHLTYVLSELLRIPYMGARIRVKVSENSLPVEMVATRFGLVSKIVRMPYMGRSCQR